MADAVQYMEHLLHVQTVDARVNPKGTGYITDLGMTGPLWSVLGIEPEQSIAMFRGDLTEYFRPAKGETALMGAVFEIEPSTGKCNSVTRVFERMDRKKPKVLQMNADRQERQL